MYLRTLEIPVCSTNKLDPCHYFTSPGLAWDAKLKMTVLNWNYLQTLICSNLLKEECKVVFITLQADMVPEIINIANT